MDGFLLVIRCEVDDVPVGLFESRQDAITYARSITRSQFSKIAVTAGFPEDAVPIAESAIQVVQFKSHEPVASEQCGHRFPKPLSRQIADTVKPLIGMAIDKIDCDDKPAALLLAVADAVQDASAEVGEDASDEAADIRRLVESWQLRRAAQ